MKKELGMSKKLKDSKSKIESLSKTILDHLLYVIIFGKTTYTKHWINELSDKFEIVWDFSYLKGGIRINYSTLLENLVPGQVDDKESLYSWCLRLLKDKKDLKPLYAPEDVTVVKMHRLYLNLSSECLGSEFDRVWFEKIVKSNIETIFKIKL